MSDLKDMVERRDAMFTQLTIDIMNSLSDQLEVISDCLMNHMNLDNPIVWKDIVIDDNDVVILFGFVMDVGPTNDTNFYFRLGIDYQLLVDNDPVRITEFMINNVQDMSIEDIKVTPNDGGDPFDFISEEDLAQLPDEELEKLDIVVREIVETITGGKSHTIDDKPVESETQIVDSKYSFELDELTEEQKKSFLFHATTINPKDKQ